MAPNVKMIFHMATENRIILYVFFRSYMVCFVCIIINILAELCGIDCGILSDT